MIFYMGTHLPNWLERCDFPLFVSRRTMPKKPMKPISTWCLDSGGFSELALYGGWRTTPEEYVDEVARFVTYGGLQWAAPQDWMCEPSMLAKTGLRVIDHQHLTTMNFLRLKALAPDLPFIPVIQGWTLEDYKQHITLYRSNGIDLTQENTVGVGSVCRRTSVGFLVTLFNILYSAGIKCHGFGLKGNSLPFIDKYIQSADSLAWSASARRSPPMPECIGRGHKNCANCILYAMKWRQRIEESINVNVS